MAKQVINISAPNDHLGDPLRTAFDKTNDNFTELYTGKVSGYSDTITLLQAAVTTITTTITTLPYSIHLTESDGTVITSGVTIKQYLDGGFCKLDIYSTDAIVNAKLYIIY